MKIFNPNGSQLLDVLVTANAKHKQELMKSDFVSLEWNDSVYRSLPMGAYIIPFANGVKYALFAAYQPENNSGVYIYRPQFQAPAQILANTPCLFKTMAHDEGRPEGQKDYEVLETDWVYTGDLQTIVGRIVIIIFEQTNKHLEPVIEVRSTTSLPASATCSFNGVDIMSALAEICSQFGGIEYHVDWEGGKLYIGDVTATGAPVALQEGVNVQFASVSQNSEPYANYFIVRGGTRNITATTQSGTQVQSNIRLELDNAGSVIDKRTDKINEPKVQKILIFDDVYPHLNLYAYNIRQRVRRLTDTQTGAFIPKSYNPDGSVKEYKKYSVYYMRLAYPNDDAWTDFAINPSQDIIAGKKLTCSAEPNELGTHSQLAGREFELIYHTAAQTIIPNPSIEDSGINVLAGDYEIVFEQEEDFIIPNADTLQPWGENIPSLQGDIFVLFNIVLKDDYLTKARAELKAAANMEIERIYTDNNNYTVKSNAVAFATNAPALKIGSSVDFTLLNGTVMNTRVLKLVTKLDQPSEQEITIGNAIIKGTTETIKEDVKTLTAAIDINESSATTINKMISQLYRTLREYENMYLHKDKDDETPFKLGAEYLDVKTLAKIFGNLQSDGFKRDMSFGKGWGVDVDGNMQVESLEVRSALRVLELVYNRLSAEESEYVFTEAGTIKELTALGGGKYKCIMEKRGDTDFHAFRVGDVLRGIVNNLANLGGGEYYTTWLHVESTNAQGDNSMVVSLYPDSDCPSGRNYPPTSLMVVQRWGNSIPATKENHENPEYRAIIDLVDGKYVNRRQSCWYLSSNEKRIAMLDGVTQPKLSQNNYAAFFGLPYDIKTISGHSLNPTQPYLYARGAFIQDLHFIDYKGNVIRIERFRGEWDVNVASGNDPYVSNSSTFDTVYHNNAKWECVVEQARVDEPSDTNTDWKLLQSAVEGESTPQYTLIPSVAVVQRDAEGVPDVDIVTCKVRKTVGDDTTTEITDRLFYSINDGDPIQGSFVELKKDDGIEKITFMLLPKNVEEMGVARFGISKFQITKIEAIVDVLNKAQRGAILRGPSEWKPNVEYMGGARGEEYQDMVVRTIDGVTEYFLCHYTHTNKDPHDASHQANSKWDADRPWQKSQVSDFVATRILYSEQIKADIMRVVNASIDELIVGRLQTMEENGATIDISGGLMRVMKTGNIQPNIEFGLDADGYAVLKYYNNEGKLLYNLGPRGIMFEISVQWAYYTPISLYLQWSNLDDDLGTIMPFNPTSAYLWRQGIKKLGEIENYSAYWRDWISLQEDEKWQEEKFTNDGKVVTAKAEEGKQPTSILSEGIYAVHTMPPTTTEGHVMPVIVKEYVDGKENRQFVIWNVRNNDTWHICMPDGSHYVGVRKLRQYLINTNQLSD